MCGLSPTRMLSDGDHARSSARPNVVVMLPGDGRRNGRLKDWPVRHCWQARRLRKWPRTTTCAKQPDDERLSPITTVMVPWNKDEDMACGVFGVSMRPVARSRRIGIADGPAAVSDDANRPPLPIPRAATERTDARFAAFYSSTATTCAPPSQALLTCYFTSNKR